MEEKIFVEHLDDLRSCILKSLVGVAVSCVIAFAFVTHIFNLLSKPYIDFLVSTGRPVEAALRSLGPADTLQVTFKAALLFGLGLASPWIAYQLWGFGAPALYKHEKKHIAAFCMSVACFFLLGVVFAYFLVLPAAISFFYNYTSGFGITPDWAVANYFGFVVAFLAGFGIVFELPVAVVILTWLGVTTPQVLAKYRRHAIIGIFIVAAIFTPGPDIASQLMMAVPMVVLYEFSILAARVVR